MGSCAKITAACILGALGSIASGAAMAADLVILTNQGATPGVRELAAAFSRASGHKVTVVQADDAVLQQRLNDGTADLITGNPGPIDELVKSGKVVAATVTPFVSGFRCGPARPNPTSARWKPTRRRCSRPSRSAIRAAAAARMSQRGSRSSASAGS